MDSIDDGQHIIGLWHVWVLIGSKLLCDITAMIMVVCFESRHLKVVRITLP